MDRVTIQAREQPLAGKRLNACTGHGTDQLIGGARQSLRVTAANKPRPPSFVVARATFHGFAGSRRKGQRKGGRGTHKRERCE